MTMRDSNNPRERYLFGCRPLIRWPPMRVDVAALIKHTHGHKRRALGPDILVTVHHSSMSEANPRGGDLNLRSGPQMEEYGAIVDRIRSDRSANILDWGAGHGQVSNLLHQAGLDVTAFDYQPDVPDGPRPMERYPHLSVHLGSDRVGSPSTTAASPQS